MLPRRGFRQAPDRSRCVSGPRPELAERRSPIRDVDLQAVGCGLEGATSIRSSRLRACTRSQALCFRSQNSALDQPAFSNRIAISGETAARPFSTRDNV